MNQFVAFLGIVEIFVFRRSSGTLGSIKHLVIVDGHHLMYRAYYAIPRTMQTAAGMQTNAMYGVASMLITMLRTEQPDAMLFAFDAGEETFRHQENATYKEGRAETPDEFYLQIPKILQMIATFQIRSVSDGKYEADDFLCTYAVSAVKAGMRVTIVTGDRDAFQLANEHVRIAIPHKGYHQPEYLGPNEIFAKYGIHPDQVPSYKGLCGDASDNLPGVKGIGPKTASMLLQQYHTLRGIYDHLDAIKPTIRAKLERDKEQAFFCEHMAQLVPDIALPVPLDELMLKGIATEPVLELFREWEFTSLSNRLTALCKTPFGVQCFAAPLETAPTPSNTIDQMTLF